MWCESKRQRLQTKKKKKLRMENQSNIYGRHYQSVQPHSIHTCHPPPAPNMERTKQTYSETKRQKLQESSATASTQNKNHTSIQ